MTSEQFPFGSVPTGDRQILRVVAIGSPQVVENYILTQYCLGYAEVHEWSKPLPTPNPGEVMRILTKRLMV
ncbi:MAG TPA: hypothetical protein V6C65_24755 [Allocoleopsis sp.]